MQFLSTGSLRSGANSSTLVLAGTNTGNNTLAQVINDSGGTTNLSKFGVGTWVLTGISTYSGSTSITSGKLVVSGGISGVGAVAVNNGATLDGSGIVAGAVTVASGGTLVASASNFTTGALSLTGSGKFSLQINTALGTSSKVTASGLSLDAANTAVLALTDMGADTALLAGTKFTALIYAGGSWNGSLFTFGGQVVADDTNITLGLNQYTVNYNDLGATALTLLVVPEPTDWAMFLGGAGMLGLFRRRSLRLRS